MKYLKENNNKALKLCINKKNLLCRMGFADYRIKVLSKRLVVVMYSMTG